MVDIDGLLEAHRQAEQAAGGIVRVHLGAIDNESLSLAADVPDAETLLLEGFGHAFDVVRLAAGRVTLFSVARSGSDKEPCYRPRQR